MSSFLALAIVVALCLIANGFFRLTRSVLRRPKPIHWVWSELRRRPLGCAPRTSREKARWALARALAWYAGRPLRVQPFEGKQGVDAAAVSSALSAAMTHIGSSRKSGVDMVSAPITAGTAMEAVAEAVKGAPSGGQLAAGLLRLFGWLIARGELQLSGHVLSSRMRGPGVALTIATAGGRVLERETLWASDFEPAVGADEAFDDGDDADRLLRVATAGAVWTHFTIFSEVWYLSEEELETNFQTSSWQSYALMQVGIDGQAKRRPDVTRALYARAVDADPSNLVAQFNLASLELRDELLAQVRTAGVERLDAVHESLHLRDGSCAEKYLRAIDAKEEARLLDCDPLHHQVVYKQVAAKLNHDLALEALYEASLPGRWLASIPPYALWLTQGSPEWPGGEWWRTNPLSLECADLEEIREHLWTLEQTLVVLYEANKERWSKADSKQWIDLKHVLSAVEGPMVLLWAMIAVRVGRPVWMPWSQNDLREPGGPSAQIYDTKDPHQATRRWLIERLRCGRLTPGEAVGYARSSAVPRTSRTRFNLACWFADADRLAESLRELELSLESGGELAGRRLYDVQLRRVRKAHRKEWRKLQSRYAPTPPGARAGGDRPAQTGTRANGNRPAQSVVGPAG
jgi:hypothetical protein